MLTEARAATPKGVAVMAKQIDDIVSFDPAESYEFTNGEMDANCYRRLIRPDLDDATKIEGDLAEKWDVSPDGLTFTFKSAPRRQIRFRQSGDRERRCVQPASRGQAEQDTRLHRHAVRLQPRQRGEDDPRDWTITRWR